MKPMVYGRYNELVFMGLINQLITGGHHPVRSHHGRSLQSQISVRPRSSASWFGDGSNVKTYDLLKWLWGTSHDQLILMRQCTKVNWSTDLHSRLGLPKNHENIVTPKQIDFTEQLETWKLCGTHHLYSSISSWKCSYLHLFGAYNILTTYCG
jgi:hypothetical protein